MKISCNSFNDIYIYKEDNGLDENMREWYSDYKQTPEYIDLIYIQLSRLFVRKLCLS